MLSFMLFFTIPINLISSFILENKEQNVSFSNSNNDILLSTLHGEYCGGKICVENQFCDEFLLCKCCEGFKSFLDVCIPCASEGEKCIVTSGCCENLYCIAGVCRKTIPEDDFIHLGKVCLIISAAAVAIITFGLFVKLLFRYCRFQQPQNFYRNNGTTGMNFTHTSSGQYMSCGVLSEVEQEKPPSYEECIRSSPIKRFSEPPPPYIISSNLSPVSFSQTNSNCLGSSNVSTTYQNLSTMPLNVKSSSCSLNIDSLSSKVLKCEENLRHPPGVSSTKNIEHI